MLTCGPASADEKILARLVPCADSFRLNVAHLDSAGLEAWLDRLASLRHRFGKEFGIILDLQGAKVRVGKFDALDFLPDKIQLFFGESSNNAARIPVPNENVFKKTAVGDHLLLNDRRVILRVTATAQDFLEAEVVQNGPLSSFKGINSPDRVFELPRIMPGDAAAIAMGKTFANVAFAVSFVADGLEAALFRKYTENCRLIGKIEQVAAFANLAQIAANFDELWLCRGDLGAEAGLRELGPLQQRFVSSIAGLNRPCLIAGEVLGSLVFQPRPGRAEIVQLYDSLNQGFSGFVLSDETACGSHVIAVADFLESFFSAS